MRRHAPILRSSGGSGRRAFFASVSMASTIMELLVVAYVLFLQSSSIDDVTQEERVMNNIIWLVGAVVIVLAILSFFGLR
ncbi:hypothetical protein [Mesorhizobium sp. STM 4661]|uniref:hypothetical protein n=1 Tax=Mesorhizobium sp. STM 4661 TaxID=1297570 RepID=UPI00055E12AC|nr:hypothetical protein [Mesorhizobium sp. STM 4661]